MGGLPHMVGGNRQGSRAHTHGPCAWVPACWGAAGQASASGGLVLLGGHDGACGARSLEEGWGVEGRECLS